MSVPDLAGMALFVAVVEAGGFSAAAAAEGLSKSQVSKRIARLEDSLGVRLLHRNSRQVTPTGEGQHFYAACRRMLDAAEEAEASLQALAESPRGEIKVNGPMSFGLKHLAPALPQLFESCPDISVELTLNDRRVDLIDEGYDLAIRIGTLEDSSLIARRLAPCAIVLAASPDYLARAGTPTHPRELAEHSCLLYRQAEARGIWRLAGPGGQERVAVSGPLAANNGDILAEAARRGLGIVLTPTFIVGDDLRAGRLVPVLRGWCAPGDQAIHAIYPASRNLSPKVRVFVDFLAGQFGSPPYWDRDLDI